ncbi:hypothetical protein HDU76_002651 [Blyttiomyces sp. JEL0837]|nr:hypothetical protein HDU76_002651 [Blyttiomyces sp. JEL0837]
MEEWTVAQESEGDFAFAIDHEGTFFFSFGFRMARFKKTTPKTTSESNAETQDHGSITFSSGSSTDGTTVEGVTPTEDEWTAMLEKAEVTAATKTVEFAKPVSFVEEVRGEDKEKVDKMLVEKEKEFKDLQEEFVLAKDSWLQSVVEDVEKLGIEFKWIKGCLLEKEGKIVQIDDLLKKKEVKVDELNTALSQKDVQLVEVTDVLKDKEAKIVKILGTLDEKGAEMVETLALLMKKEVEVEEVLDVLVGKEEEWVAANTSLKEAVFDNESVKALLAARDLELGVVKKEVEVLKEQTTQKDAALDLLKQKFEVLRSLYEAEKKEKEGLLEKVVVPAVPDEVVANTTPDVTGESNRVIATSLPVPTIELFGSTANSQATDGTNSNGNHYHQHPPNYHVDMTAFERHLLIGTSALYDQDPICRAYGQIIVELFYSLSSLNLAFGIVPSDKARVWSHFARKATAEAKKEFTRYQEVVATLHTQNQQWKTYAGSLYEYGVDRDQWLALAVSQLGTATVEVEKYQEETTRLRQLLQKSEWESRDVKIEFQERLAKLNKGIDDFKTELPNVTAICDNAEEKVLNLTMENRDLREQLDNLRSSVLSNPAPERTANNQVAATRSDSAAFESVQQNLMTLINQTKSTIQVPAGSTIIITNASSSTSSSRNTPTSVPASSTKTTITNQSQHTRPSYTLNSNTPSANKSNKPKTNHQRNNNRTELSSERTTGASDRPIINVTVTAIDDAVNDEFDSEYGAGDNVVVEEDLGVCCVFNYGGHCAEIEEDDGD